MITVGNLSFDELKRLDQLAAPGVLHDDGGRVVGFVLTALTSDAQDELAALCSRARVRVFDSARGEWWPRLH